MTLNHVHTYTIKTTQLKKYYLNKTKKYVLLFQANSINAISTETNNFRYKYKRLPLNGFFKTG